ncbi:MAG TPA: DegV family protein [Rhodanobacteraceae bacterium]|nr:DegV family protein [Rhodanobacteraceae bacterium]
MSANATRIPEPLSATYAPGGRALKRALIAGIGRVLASRETLNRINVFPVADGDTGSNLAFTLSAVLEAVRPIRHAHAGMLLERAASEAIDGARGNSGAILAQFLQGASEALSGVDRLRADHLVAAAGLGSAQARAAVAEPREGTMLSVIAAFADALARTHAIGMADLRETFAQALAATRQALADTPQQLGVLRRAGVVDAGAMGFVELLEGIQDFMLRGRRALRANIVAVNAAVGVFASVEDAADDAHRYCTECVLAAEAIDRDAVRAALATLPSSSLVMAGTRERLRVHAHVDEPALLFDTLSAFGNVTARKADDMHAQQRATRTASDVAVVVDSAADIPPGAFERLPLHLVPVRINFGAQDYLDKVSLSAREFYAELARSTQPVRTSQPPPGDFRRLFEFLLSHHAEVVYVGLSRAVSGTLQSAERAAQETDPKRVRVVDTRNGSGGQGLLAVHAAERALAGADAAAIAAELATLAQETRTFAYVRDLSNAVRGGRMPRWALPITQWLRLVPVVRLGGGDGRLHVGGVMRDRGDLPARFVARVLRCIDRGRRWRAEVLHCDSIVEGEKVRSALLRLLPDADVSELLDAGSAIGAHAGPGAVVISLMPDLRSHA